MVKKIFFGVLFFIVGVGICQKKINGAFSESKINQVDQHSDDAELIRQLDENGKVEFVKKLIAEMKGDDGVKRVYAAAILKKHCSILGKAALMAIPRLEYMIQHEYTGVQLAACDARLAIEKETAKAIVCPVLIKIMTTDDEPILINLMAADILLQIDKKSVEDILPKKLNGWIDLLKTVSPEHKVYIARTIGRIGPAAKMAIPVLTELTNHSDPNVRQVAIDALKALKVK